jgi:hypothetical protein
MKYLIVFALSFATSCASSLVKQELDPDVIYKRDIGLTINGVAYKGIAVPAPAASYILDISGKGTINMLTITTCHREHQFEFDPGYFKKGHTLRWTYTPVKGIEDKRGCMLEIGAYEKTKGRHAWGMIDFQTPTETVPAKMNCDGTARAVGPVSICQSKAGLLQKIEFDRRMKVAPDQEQCKVMKTVDEKTYEFITPKGECTYYFGDIDGKFHRLTTFGYENILIREE